MYSVGKRNNLSRKSRNGRQRQGVKVIHGIENNKKDREPNGKDKDQRNGQI